MKIKPAEQMTRVLGSALVAGTFDRAMSGVRTVAFHGVPSAQAFERTLLVLLSRYEPVSPRDVASADSRRPLVITFDDGHASTVEHALPVLLRHRVPAVMFICPAFVEGEGLFWWDAVDHADSLGHAESIIPGRDLGRSLVAQLKELPDELRRAAVATATDLAGDTAPRNAARRSHLEQWLDSGMELGNHSWDHPCLDQCDDESQRRQVTSAHQWLGEFVGSVPRLFAYPNGDWSLPAEETLRHLDYESAFLFDHRIGRFDADPLRRSRLRLDSNADVRRVRAIASGGHSAVFELDARRRSAGLATTHPTTGGPLATTNRAVFDSGAVVLSYDPSAGLTPAERVLIDRWVIPGSRVLDLGVGTGRTYPSLAARAATYVGSDYSPVMVEAARRAHPEGSFEVVDAADLSRFPDQSFDSVVFSYNGLDYLHPDEARSTALREVRRVLAPGGVFIMSSHNPRAVVHRPRPSSSGLRALAKSLTVASYATFRAGRALVTTRAFWTGSGYAVDRIQPLLTRYSTVEHLTAELRAAGLEPVEHLPGDHPRPMRRFISPWTYVAAQRPTFEFGALEVLEGRSGWDEVAEAWDRLAAVDDVSFFQSRTWCEAWLDHLAPSAEVAMVVAREESGSVVGLLPLARTTRAIHSKVPIRLRYLGLAGAGPGAADGLGPLARDEATAARLVAKAAELAAKETMYLENLSERWVPTTVAATGGRIIRSTTRLVAVRGAHQSFESLWSKKVRKNDRRRQRQLQESSVAARWVSSSQPGFADALKSLQQVHVLRWEAEDGAGLFDDRRLEFLTNLGERLCGADRAWVLLLEAGPDVVGGLLGFHHGTTFSVYKTGWDPRYRLLGIGIALGAEAMRWSAEHGVTTFDYLRGPRSHKRDLGCVGTVDHSIIAARGPSGRLMTLREQLGADGIRPRWWPS